MTHSARHIHSTRTQIQYTQQAQNFDDTHTHNKHSSLYTRSSTKQFKQHHSTTKSNWYRGEKGCTSTSPIESQRTRHTHMLYTHTSATTHTPRHRQLWNRQKKKTRRGEERLNSKSVSCTHATTTLRFYAHPLLSTQLIEAGLHSTPTRKLDNPAAMTHTPWIYTRVVTRNRTTEERNSIPTKNQQNKTYTRERGRYIERNREKNREFQRNRE